jgi:NitT/TauT family transport system ATP-binding protein
MVIIDNFSLKRGSKQLYKDFSMSFQSDTVTALLATSGAGKTSLLECIAGLLKADNGTITNTAENSQSISYLFQEPRLLPWVTVLKNLMLPINNKEEGKERALYFLDKVGLSNKANAYPKELSGGEKQRVALARAFTYKAPLLFLDEAFQSQDIHLKFQLMELFIQLLEEEKRTVLLVTHDIKEALCLAHRIVLLKGEPLQIVYDKAVEKSYHFKEKGYISDAYIHLSNAHRAEEQEILEILSN